LPVPTHKPGCKVLHFRPAHCNTCNQVVTYWACSCGASVLFDAVGKPWPCNTLIVTPNEQVSGSNPLVGSLYPA
jgi:hypothetical protein